MKTYYEQNYKYELDVIVTIRDEQDFVTQRWIDGIKGLNKGHALYQARKNWMGCEVHELVD